jgi:hypothetical protein
VGVVLLLIFICWKVRAGAGGRDCESVEHVRERACVRACVQRAKNKKLRAEKQRKLEEDMSSIAPVSISSTHS